MAGYKCPYCGEVTSSNNSDCKRSNTVSFYEQHGVRLHSFTWAMNKCASCGKVALFILGNSQEWGGELFYSYPPASIKAIPGYVPQAIRQDYAEAYSILRLSPKAAATLARRCLQGMIHDFWDIREKNLNAEITALKSKLSAGQWAAIDALRKLGNIGAHMEKDVDRIIDVDPDEAEKLLKLIELLIDKWYVARHDEELLLQEIAELGDQKEAERKA